MAGTITPAEARHRVWRDRDFAEEWEWRGERVLRYRSMVTYPWTYRIGAFTMAHEPFADRRDRAMTQDEIEAFKRSRSV